MSEKRRCCRPGCPNRAVATLTYVYADSTAVVGPLSAVDEPHSWDLCAAHALRITAPRGWDLVRHPDIDDDEDADLTALLDAVTGTPAAGAGSPAAQDQLAREDRGAALVGLDRLRRLGVADPTHLPTSPVAPPPGPANSGSRPKLRVVRSEPSPG